MGVEDFLRERVKREGYDLFAVFSRFDFALKRGGFRQDGKAEASWQKFADALPDNFFDRMRASDEARVLFEAPPDHLVPTDQDGVTWSRSPKDVEDAKSLFGAVRTVRNNLLHGEKGNMSPREVQLIRASLFVLNSAFETAGNDDKFARFVRLICE